MITLTETHPNHYIVVFENGAIVGSIYMEEDGFYGYQLTIPIFGIVYESGFFEAPFLRLIADTLDGMNEEWEETIDSDPAISGNPSDLVNER